MNEKTSSFWESFTSRDDLQKFGRDALLLFALQLRFGIEDIDLVANNSLTEGADDKKADLVYIDSEMGRAIIAQAYMSEDVSKKGAPANKASDLNTAVSWLLTRPLGELPESLKTHAEELRQAIRDGAIKSINIWYVHNLPESHNVENELTTVEHTANSLVKANFPDCDVVEIQALEIGIATLEEWYESISTPILVSEEFTIPSSGGFKIGDADWNAYVTTIPAGWLHEQFQLYRTKLFSANVRDYLGSRKVDNNINNGMKRTAHDDPGHFWVFNNGITVLVHEFKEIKSEDKTEVYIKGFAIVNGSQTTGAIGNLDEAPGDNAMVQVRFITCNNPETVYDIVKYNNSQNKITAPDFRSTDRIQRRLVAEFVTIPAVDYIPRRGGHEDVIRRRPNVLPSVTAGQALAAFHGDPDIAYHEKTHMWENDTLYSKYFNDQTTAKHIIFAYSLLKSVDKKKLDLWNKSKADSLLEVEKSQLDFFHKRGSTFLMASAIARCLEIILNKPTPNLFDMIFRADVSLADAANKWAPIVEAASAFTAPLVEGLSDRFKTRDTVSKSIQIFQSLVNSTKQGNASIYSTFAEQIA